MIYLDNAATSFPKAPGVGQAVYDYLSRVGANAGRASYKSAREASGLLFEARENLAALLGVSDDAQICFTSNATEALNTVILGAVKSGDTVLTSRLEHNSVMRPLRWLEATKDVKIIQFGLDENGDVNLDEFRDKLLFTPDFVISTACSNVSGLIFPYQEIGRLTKEIGAKYILDASQLVGMYPFNVDENMDAVCFPGHKGLLGPSGTGAFYLKQGFQVKPLMFGGTGSRSEEEFQPDFLPDKFESGTPNLAGLAGLNTSLEFLLKTGISKLREHKLEIIAQLINGLEKIDHIKIHSPKNLEQQIGVISITSEKMDISELTAIMDKEDIALRMGMHCAPSAHKELDTFKQGGTVRLSPGYFTTSEEIEKVLEVLAKI